MPYGRKLQKGVERRYGRAGYALRASLGLAAVEVMP